LPHLPLYDVFLDLFTGRLTLVIIPVAIGLEDYVLLIGSGFLLLWGL
jgi:hypothetical protein